MQMLAVEQGNEHVDVEQGAHADSTAQSPTRRVPTGLDGPWGDSGLNAFAVPQSIDLLVRRHDAWAG